VLDLRVLLAELLQQAYFYSIFLDKVTLVCSVCELCLPCKLGSRKTGDRCERKAGLLEEEPYQRQDPMEPHQFCSITVATGRSKATDVREWTTFKLVNILEMHTLYWRSTQFIFWTAYKTQYVLVNMKYSMFHASFWTFIKICNIHTSRLRL
jgi:hypothetical protein